jgi:hypothetical protein
MASSKVKTAEARYLRWVRRRKNEEVAVFKLMDKQQKIDDMIKRATAEGDWR